jgi:hypothetical protein
MQLLKDRILTEGHILPGNIIKVDGFLNHQLDVALIAAYSYMALVPFDSAADYAHVDHAERAKGCYAPSEHGYKAAKNSVSHSFNPDFASAGSLCRRTHCYVNAGKLDSGKRRYQSNRPSPSK